MFSEAAKAMLHDARGEGVYGGEEGVCQYKCVGEGDNEHRAPLNTRRNVFKSTTLCKGSWVPVERRVTFRFVLGFSLVLETRIEISLIKT